MNMMLSTAAMTAVASPAICEQPDPAFAAIDAHKAARVKPKAACAESSRILNLCDETVGPHEIQVLDMRDPTNPAKLYVPAIGYQIDELIPPNEHPELNAHYHARWEERHAERLELFSHYGDIDEIVNVPCSAEWNIYQTLVETVPTSLADAVAMIHYIAEYLETDRGAATDEELHCLVANISEGLRACA